VVADGKRIAFFNVDGMWRVAEMSVLDVATGTVTKIHDSLPQPGAPTWSPDGKRVALPKSRRSPNASAKARTRF
jgi:Tol biopolymer transport system component